MLNSEILSYYFLKGTTFVCNLKSNVREIKPRGGHAHMNRQKVLWVGRGRQYLLSITMFLAEGRWLVPWKLDCSILLPLHLANFWILNILCSLFIMSFFISVCILKYHASLILMMAPTEAESSFVYHMEAFVFLLTLSRGASTSMCAYVTLVHMAY